MNRLFKILPLLLLINTISINAWIYPEHRDIALRAIEKLSDKHSKLLQEIWNIARKSYEHRLSENVIEQYRKVEVQRLDFAAWPAIAGDHSCSPSEMLNNVLNTEWILEVAKVAAELRIDLAMSNSILERINALRKSDSNFQNADPEYATRAGSNNVHFLIALKDIDTSLKEYIRNCTVSGSELNAIGIYSLYHNSALKKAALFHSEKLTGDERSQLAISILSDEAFALHFLEDIFAAGHVAGTWGDASQRKGTHDYYNEKGLRTTTWNNEEIIITGDAYMREMDSKRASHAVKLSLEQLLRTINKKSNNYPSDTVGFRTPNKYSACSNSVFTDINYDENFLNKVEEIISYTPRPGLASGVGELPRFRSELGLFAGFAPALRGSMIFGGYNIIQEKQGLVGGLEAAIRMGVGLDGVLGESGDGLAFLEFGWRQDGSSTNDVLDIEGGIPEYGALFSAVPARSGFSARLRLPFYLIPGDLLISAPFLLIFSPETLTNMGATAVNGGLLHWQTGFITPIGKFQIIAGREIGIYLFGRGRYRDTILQPGINIFEEISLFAVSYRSVQIEVPILEYTPLRSFAFDQSSTIRFQLYGGVDIPSKVEILDEEIPTFVFLENIWYLGVRLVFDWRYYF